MTGRLQLIEQKLIAIDPAGFQNLCDTYLILRETEYSSFNRTGSKLGKQKTVLGTPDSFVRLSENKLAYIEYTTQADSIVSKICNDIDKCLDSSKTGVERSQVYQILVCFNSRLTISEETQIQHYAKSNNIRVELIGIDTLAIEIMSKYLLLSRDFLDIPIDTGQILPFDKFIAEYNNKASQLSTPLDNKFLNRDKELEEILYHLELEDLLILSGAPGVGKTKLGIEAINKFIESNSGYQSFAISKKDVDIYEDLKIQIKSERNYILLIDDANRQLSNLSQILGIFKEVRKGELKIIITVRNYALSDIFKASYNFKSHTINILKFTDEEITKILESESFNIKNPKYQKKIVEISDGNARLAVMGAKLAQEKQTDFLWGDVSDLFDSYFNSFLSDFDLFENRTLLKTLALTSFFFTINRGNRALIETILDLFKIDYYGFNEAIEELHKRELIEVQFNHARISEQVMATYFFYKVFIKENLLSFKDLLFNFYPEWKSRFKDSIIPANNSFGYDNVISQINPTLNDYLNYISEDEEKVLDFLDLFWFYKPEDTITHFYNKTNSLPESINPVFLTKYDTNDFVFEQEKTIDFISRFFNHSTEYLVPAIHLGFEYIRKKPNHLPEFIRRIREHLVFDEGDERIGFQRQVKFINILITKVKQGEPHYISAFFALSKTFLKHYSDVTHGGRKHTITFYKYPLPFYDVTQTIRKDIWETIFELYDEYSEETFEVISGINPNHHELIPEILDFDLQIVIPFIQAKFSPTNFKHAYFINNLTYWLDRETELKDRSYRKLKAKYQTEEYSNYCKLSWNRLRDKNEFDYDFSDYQEYTNLKTEEIKKHFTFSSEEEFEKLHKTIANVLLEKEDNHYTAGQSIDIVVKQNFINNRELGFNLFLSVLDKYPSGLHFLYGTVNEIAKSSEEWCIKLWNAIDAWNNKNKLFWKITFFNYVKQDYINEFYCQKLIETIKSIDDFAYIYLELYEQYGKIHENIVVEIMNIVVNKNDQQIVKIILSDDIFEKKLDLINIDYQLLKKAYFQQFKFNHSQIFDYHGRGFDQIIQLYPDFLIDFLDEFCTSRKLRNRDLNIKLNFIWEHEDYENIVSKASNLLIEKNTNFSFEDHSHTLLFKDVKEPQREKAYTFILNKITTYNSNSKRVSIYFNTIKQCMNEKFEEAFLYFLSINHNINIFEEIDWVGNVGVITGEANFGDLYAKRWEDILGLVNKSNDDLALIPIKSFLKRKIASQYKWAESERERKFITPEW